MQMDITPNEKAKVKQLIVACLKDEPEIERIIVFGSFLTSESPADIDVAVFQNSTEKYLPLALKYRRKIEPVAKQIAVDVIPLRPAPPESFFLKQILKGEIIYEK
jgi:predicted nucleotidyltransferase